jgi:pSer/pThr/pTyr-binding forkhead associated (FHA) protein
MDLATRTFYLEIITPGCPPRQQTLSAGMTIVGRSARSCGVVIGDRRVSRVHLQIRSEIGVTVTDLYSANGSTLAGHPLPSGVMMYWLLDQVVSIGHSYLVLRYGRLE